MDPDGIPLHSLIGRTPLVPLRFRAEGRTLLAKCEFLNPSGSIKDRFAQCVVADAERRGLLQRDSVSNRLFEEQGPEAAGGPL
jgi:cysteine synthase A